MKLPARRFELTELENRSVPAAAYGDLWPDATGLTLSFAPDGTHASGQNTNLIGTLNHIASTSAWQREVLRAFQTWAASANVNIGLVSDNHADFGTAGDVEGDSRFGDIRVGGIAQSAGTVATTSPFDWSIGTWSGDMLFNTAQAFTTNPNAASPAPFDLYTVALHEAGHDFGLEDSTTDTGSVMYQYYQGRATGLAPQDVAAVQAVYGPRQPDAYEGANGNDTLATAAPLGTVTSLALAADITTPCDVDYYAVTVPAGADRVSVKLLTTGYSLFTGTVSIYNAAGQQLATAADTDPTRGDLAVQIGSPTVGATYYVRVAGTSNDVFSVGGYRMTVETRSYNTQANPTFVNDNGSNDSFATATVLAPTSGSNSSWSRHDFAYRGKVETTTDVDDYQLTVPAGTTTQALVVRLRNLDNGVMPALAIYDAGQNLLPADVIAQNSGSITVQVTGVSAGDSYYVRVAPGAASGSVTQKYVLTADLQDPVVVGLGEWDANTLTADQPSVTGTLGVTTSSLFQFSLGALGLTPGDQTSVTMTVFDSRNHTALTLNDAPRGGQASASVYLVAGSYQIRYTATAAPGSAVGEVGFSLDGGIFSEPTGTFKTTSTGTTTGGGSGGGYTYTGSSSRGLTYAF